MRAGGAAAITVLTEPAHFGGSHRRPRSRCAPRSRVPALKKDFHVDPSSCSRRARSARRRRCSSRARSRPTARASCSTLGARARARAAGRGARRGASWSARSTRGADDDRRQQPRSRDARHRSGDRRAPRSADSRRASSRSPRAASQRRADVERVRGCGADAVLVGLEHLGRRRSGRPRCARSPACARSAPCRLR